MATFKTGLNQPRGYIFRVLFVLLVCREKIVKRSRKLLHVSATIRAGTWVRYLVVEGVKKYEEVGGEEINF